VGAAKLAGADVLGWRVGKVVSPYKLAKYFELAIGSNSLNFARKHVGIFAEAALDGIKIVRTSVPTARMAAPEYVRNDKSMAKVERAFRSFRTIDLKVRPIHHCAADRVCAHIFLCMLAKLCRAAPARGLARADVRGYRPARQGRTRLRSVVKRGVQRVKSAVASRGTVAERPRVRGSRAAPACACGCRRPRCTQ